MFLYLCADNFAKKVMKRVILTIVMVVVCLSCGGRASSSKGAMAAIKPVEPKYYTYEVKSKIDHPTERYTQGLLFADGALWEGTGLNGASALYRTDLATGKTRCMAELPRSEFGEGIALLDGKIYQLTWTSNTAHVYDAATGKKLRDLRYAGEGWGLTSDGKRLYMSDGSARIFRIDPETFRREGSITVTLRGEAVEFINELEWIDGKIWANVYTTESILIINPESGVVEGVIDLSGIFPQRERTEATDVMNGIAYDAATGRVFVTGKLWRYIYQIEIIEEQ